MTFRCDICSYEAPIQKRLDDHIKSKHEKVKRFHCDLCEYACYYISDMYKHKRFHEKNPLFKGKISKEKENTKESDTLTKNPLLKGENSKKKESIEESDTLKNEMPTKNSDKICKICNYEAPYPARLQHHINSNHKNIKRFYCDICNAGYYWSNSLKKHYKNIHNEELSEDLSKYASESEKKKTYYVLPRPKLGKWIVLIERI